MHISPSLAVGVLLLLSVWLAHAVVPEHSVENEAVQLRGVGPDNPVLYDNDWWFDVFDNSHSAGPTRRSGARSSTARP